MDLNYLVTVVTVQKMEDDENIIKTLAHADLEFSGENYVLTYEEHDDDGADVITRIDVRDGRRIYITRNGEISTDMILSLGERTFSRHTTPYGEMVLGITTKEIFSEMNEQGGALRFSYVSDAERKAIGTISFEIEVVRK